MVTNEKLNKGITLVALVITIVILLILAGISIQAITNTGLFANAKKAKEKSMEGQLKEEISLAIQSIQTEEIYKGNSVTLETLAGGQLEKKLKDITAELVDGEINGEYKDYEYTIDSNLNVTINGPVTGVRIKGSAEVQTGYVFEGGTVEIKVTASITEGTITGIEAPEEATIKTDTSATEKVYTVNKNGAYTFKITSDSGKTKNITAKVENILAAPQITISEVKKDSFKINIENNYPEKAITEYKYYVGEEVKQQGTTDKSYTVTGLLEDTEYSNIKVIAYINNLNKESNIEKITTKQNIITYSWDEIAEIAKAISNDMSITDDTETATVTVNGVEKTLKVGDKATLDGKKVRILGFNHDELAEPTTAYGSATRTGKAGISFEYVDFLTSAEMNSSNTSSGGWKDTPIRETLNGITYNSLIATYHIKKVKKDYIPTYNEASISTKPTEDYLWLLSCGEIWNNGYEGGVSRGYARATEGKQYKYYKINLASTSYSSPNNITKKPNEISSNLCWLRSPIYRIVERFCYIAKNGSCAGADASMSLGIAPGFSI
ncbi:fibronectin type III domain-containing protein [bacterium]|nr:fibronectin type III domain-containing protein [bacterium]